MSKQVEIENLILKYQRRLQKRKEQVAILGINSPPEILIEIEDIEEEIERLQTELDELKATSHSRDEEPISGTVQRSVRSLPGNDLLNQLLHGTDAERIEAAKAIRSLGLISALPALISVMRYDPEKSRETIPVRDAARDAIVYLGTEYREEVISAMRRIIKDKAQHRYIRRRAVYILGKLEADEALADLAGLTDDPDVQLKCNLVDALKHFRKHEVALSALMRLKNDPSKEIQNRARAAISK